MYIIIKCLTGRNIRVLGSVGPYGASLCDGSEYNGNYIDSINPKVLYDWHKPRIQALVEAGVDVLLFETIPSIGEADILLNILTEFPNKKAFLSFSCKVIFKFIIIRLFTLCPHNMNCSNQNVSY